MIRVLEGDCRAVLATLPDCSVQCCVTSPPYFGLRDYGVDGQIGLEPTLAEYIAEMVAVFREVRRVLREDGTCWLNVGDSYASGTKGNNNNGEGASTLTSGARPHVREAYNDGRGRESRRVDCGVPDKNLLMVPARVAIALQEDGWWLRSDIIWAKPNPMPESVSDRPTSAHEHVFLLTRSARYFYDAEAVAEQRDADDLAFESRYATTPCQNYSQQSGRNDGSTHMTAGFVSGKLTRNLRNVWTIATQPFPGSHFATMPPDLAERCIKAGSRPGDTILDPFGGAGTTALVADRLQRDAVLIELNPEYAAMARERVRADAGLLAVVA